MGIVKRISLVLSVLALALGASQGVFADEYLYDSTGMPVAAVDNNSIYLESGDPVAYITNDAIYDYNGKYLGWYSDGVIYDRDGYIVAFAEKKAPPTVKIMADKKLKISKKNTRTKVNVETVTVSRPKYVQEISPLPFSKWYIYSEIPAR